MTDDAMLGGLCWGALACVKVAQRLGWKRTELLSLINKAWNL